LAIDSTMIAVAGANGISYQYDPATGNWDYSYYLSTLAPGLGMWGVLFDSAKKLYAASPSQLTLFSSEDRGRSWLLDNHGMHPGDPVLAADDQYDYAAVSYPGPSTYIVKSYRRPLNASAGTAWTMTDSLLNAYFYAMGTAGGRLYAATDDSGLLYKGATPAPPPQDSGDKPFLYPNPAYGQVNMGLHFDAPQMLTVNIYDAAGRLVETPLKNYALAAGRQVVTLDIGGLARGVYIVDVSTPSKRHTERLIVE
jgi:hypothetical protein